MILDTHYLACLAHASYLIGDQGEAAVVDPRRDVQEYLDEAAAHGLTIRYVIETQPTGVFQVDAAPVTVDAGEVRAVPARLHVAKGDLTLAPRDVVIAVRTADDSGLMAGRTTRFFVPEPGR